MANYSQFILGSAFVGFIALLFAGYLIRKVMQQSAGNEVVAGIGLAIQEGAMAFLNAAKADLEKAKLNLERTVISFPFDGLITKNL